MLCEVKAEEGEREKSLSSREQKKERERERENMYGKVVQMFYHLE